MTEFTLAEVPEYAAILSLEASYCQYLDWRSWELLGTLFADDCEMLVAGKHLVGREEIIRLLQGTAPGKHLLSLPVITFDTEGDASVIVDQFFYRYPDLRAVIAGSYRDRLVRSSSGRWLIARREIVMDCVADDLSTILASGR